MNYLHEMGFGPRLLKSGGVEFRIWAPEAKSVKLSLNRSEPVVAEMSEGENGFYNVTLDDAKVNETYHFIVDKDLKVPDPASRFQPNGVHGPSKIIDPRNFKWTDEEWYGRPFEEAIIHEIHVGTFSPEGTFQGIQERLDYLENLGVTAIELMPISDFPGDFNWGYDGVLPYSPARCYGTPDDLKELINEAHLRGMMVFLDVVHNHFGPDGNYMYVYANSFFSKKHKTPWGSAINFDDKYSDIVRQYVIDNVLYWLEEYRFDGLRLDAVNTMIDISSKHILEEISEAVRSGPGEDRQVHLILENGANNAQLLRSLGNGTRLYDAQWNFDLHRACHVLATGEESGYYIDFTEEGSGVTALEHLGKTLTEGFSYQGQISKYYNESPRGKPSNHLPLTSFISYIQNHDEIGNRAFGERLTDLTEEEAVRAIAAIVLMAPSIPMLFMGEEWGSKTNFFWFADFDGDLKDAVRKGRLEEFGNFEQFSGKDNQDKIPDPCSENTFQVSKINWEDLEEEEHQRWLGYYKLLIEVRKRSIIPILEQVNSPEAKWRILEEGLLKVVWPLESGGSLKLLTNLTDCGNPSPIFTESEFNEDSVLFQTPSNAVSEMGLGTVPPWAVMWMLDPGN